jgi:hypothetical protein
MYYKVGRCPFSSPCGKAVTATRGTCPARCHFRPWTGLIPGPTQTDAARLQPLPTAADAVDFATIFLIGVALDATSKHQPFTPEGDAAHATETLKLMSNLQKRMHSTATTDALISIVVDTKKAHALTRNKPAVRDMVLKEMMDTVKALTPNERPKRSRDN